MADDSRLDRNTLTDLNTRNLSADSFNRRSAFVAKYERIFNNLRADSSCLVIVNVRAAYPNRFNLQQDIRIARYPRLRNINHFHLPNPCQHNSLHKLPVSLF
jgi:hypothetical protein